MANTKIKMKPRIAKPTVIKAGKKFNVVGVSEVGLDAYQKTAGEAVYVTDMKLPNMLYGKILRSPHAHAEIVSIDTSKAEALPGVETVITFDDTPKIRFGTGIIDDWYILAKDKVRYVGDEVAAVAAVDEETAAEAVKLIDVQYKLLPAVINYEKARNEGAPVIYEEYPNNTPYTVTVNRGDVDEAFATADHIVKGTYYTSQAYQGYMETMAAVVQPETNGGVTMWLPVQVPMKCRIVYAKALGIDAGKLRIIKPAMGGGFGAKFEYSAHLICATLALKSGKRVKMVNTRKEDIEAGNPRVPMRIDIELALKKDGTFVGKKVRTLANNGAKTVYGPPIAATTCYRIDALYDFQNVSATANLVYTNTVPNGCMRGFGNSQMITCFEMLLDRAAEELGLDPFEIRLKNAYHDGETNLHGWLINTCGLDECLERVWIMSDWAKRKSEFKENNAAPTVKKKGLGLACTMHVSGNRAFFRPFDGSSSLIRIGEEGQVLLSHGECDMGQGQDTVFAQMACEVLGITMDKISVAIVDTQGGPLGCGSFSTRGTTIGGQGVIAAATDAKNKMLAKAEDLLGVDASDLDIENNYFFNKKTGEQLASFADVAKEYVFGNGGQPITGVGFWKPPSVLPDATYYGNVSPNYPYGAHIAEVEVDVETGHVDVTNYWAVHDVGRVINPNMVSGQLEGGIVQGIGWALSEAIVYDKQGQIVNNSFLDYRMPGIKDAPNIMTDFVETNDPEGPFGAKGIGEPALNPVAAAVVNAIYDAIGVRFFSIPVTPHAVLKALKHKQQ